MDFGDLVDVIDVIGDIVYFYVWSVVFIFGFLLVLVCLGEECWDEWDYDDFVLCVDCGQYVIGDVLGVVVQGQCFGVVDDYGVMCFFECMLYGVWGDVGEVDQYFDVVYFLYYFVFEVGEFVVMCFVCGGVCLCDGF